MDIFGWLLFFAGSMVALFFGVIGASGIANVAGTLIGCALLVSGSVFVGAAVVRNAMLVTFMVNGRQYSVKPIGNGQFVGKGDNAQLIHFASLADAEAHYRKVSNNTSEGEEGRSQ